MYNFLNNDGEDQERTAEGYTAPRTLPCCNKESEISEEAGKMSAAISEGATRYALSEAGSEAAATR